jgi:hypothetical protein
MFTVKHYLIVDGPLNVPAYYSLQKIRQFLEARSYYSYYRLISDIITRWMISIGQHF